MSSGPRKVVVHESEKSQKVQMLNWIQDTLYVANQKSLSRCEKTVVGRITVDQKLLYKRYNRKITQSKLTFARITGNHEMEKEILNNVTFNTDVGREGENDVMLQRIWSTGSQKFENIRRLRSNRYNNNYSSQFKLRIRSLKEDDCRDEEQEEACVSRPMTTREPGGKMRPYTGVCRIAKSQTSQRPSTVVTSKAIQFLDQLSRKDEDEIYPKNIDDTDSGHVEKSVKEVEKNDFMTEMSNDKHSNSSLISPPIVEPCYRNNKQYGNVNNTRLLKDIDTDDNFQDDDNGSHTKLPGNNTGTDIETTDHCLPVRPHTVIGESSANRLQSDVPNRRKSAPQKSSRHTGLSGLFDLERKPTLLELHKQKMKQVDFESKINKFSSSLKDITVKNNNAVDYYIRRLEANTHKEEERKKTKLNNTHHDIVNTTEGESKRWRGNPDIRSMTTKTLDLDFKNRPSTYIEVIY